MSAAGRARDPIVDCGLRISAFDGLNGLCRGCRQTEEENTNPRRWRNGFGQLKTYR